MHKELHDPQEILEHRPGTPFSVAYRATLTQVRIAKVSMPSMLAPPANPHPPEHWAHHEYNEGAGAALLV